MQTQQSAFSNSVSSTENKKAIDGARTRGLDLGKVARYQLRHYRIYMSSLKTSIIIHDNKKFVKTFFIFFITTQAFKPKRVMGIEPTYLAWKASVLPLNYTRTSVSYEQYKLYHNVYIMSSIF